MTLLNYYIQPARVDLLSDTLVSHDGMPATLATKVLTLGHICAVIAQRGPIDFLWGIAQRLQATLYEGGIDGLGVVLPGVCGAMQAEIERRYRAGDPRSELVALGWSPSRRAFMALHLASKDDFAIETRLSGAHVSPGPVGWRPPDLPEAPSEATWINLAEHQAAVLAQEARDRGEADGRWTIGGDLVMTSLTTKGIVTKKIHRFAGYEQSIERARERWVQHGG